MSRPQVMLDIQVFEIDHQLTRAMGMHIPNNFTLINIPAGAIAALTGALGGLGGQNIQSLINQLISSGGINQANSQGIAGLLSQLTGPAKLDFQPAIRDFRRWSDPHGIEFGHSERPTFTERESGKDAGALEPARGTGE